MQYGGPVTQVKPNSSLEDVTYPWVKTVKANEIYIN